MFTLTCTLPRTCDLIIMYKYITYNYTKYYIAYFIYIHICKQNEICRLYILGYASVVHL